MNVTQRIALRLMYDANIGAIIVDGYGWVWPEHIRKSIEVAEVVLARFAK